jgi:hypothetical protein
VAAGAVWGTRQLAEFDSGIAIGAVVTALGDVCRAVGVRVCATGVTTTDQLAAVRDHGIPWGQGPLLAEPRRRPSTAGIGLPPVCCPGSRGSPPRRPPRVPGRGPYSPRWPSWRRPR